jgi:trimethylamine--corrinoid protein Co-methyltransferase
MIKGFTRKFKPLEVLTEEELEAIHRGALDVLETTGVRVEHDRALKLFAHHGCNVDFEERRVRIPSWLVEECLRKCPSHFKYKARDPRNDLMVGGNTFYFLHGMGMRYVDLDTWEQRPATVKEHRDAMIVADALDNLHFAGGYEFYMEREGIPPCMVMLENLASGIRYSAKAEHFGYAEDCEKFAIKMAKELGIDLCGELGSANPLTFYSGVVEATFSYAEAGFTLQPAIFVITGSEGPATLAGALVLSNAQMMAYVVMGQLIKPGIGMLIQHGIAPMDMQRGTYLLGGAVEHAITDVGFNQLLRRYQIPSMTCAGYISSSKKIDFQCGYEKAMGTLIAALSGGNLHIFQGGSSFELLYHPVLSILDEDIAGWIGRFLQGIEVNDETLAIDLINEVGPIPGNYLNKEHTRKWWKKEQLIPKVADREIYQVWMKTGKKDALALAKERMEEILATHKPMPLTAAQEQVVENMLNEARAYYRKKGLISDEEWTVYMKALKSA